LTQPEKIYQTLTEKFPFLSIVVYGAREEELVGVIQNADPVVTCLYDFGMIQSDSEKREFLMLAERWWFESNKLLPINIFLKDEWSKFRYTFKTLATKETVLVHGPCTSLSLLTQKKKRRSTIVVKRL